MPIEVVGMPAKKEKQEIIFGKYKKPWEPKVQRHLRHIQKATRTKGPEAACRLSDPWNTTRNYIIITILSVEFQRIIYFYPTVVRIENASDNHCCTGKSYRQVQGAEKAASRCSNRHLFSAVWKMGQRCAIRHWQEFTKQSGSGIAGSLNSVSINMKNDYKLTQTEHFKWSSCSDNFLFESKRLFQ